MKPLIGLFVAVSLVAALIAGLDGLLYIATLGTAIGTVGLAFSTWRLSLLTQSTVEQTQTELKIAEQGVVAATESAKEAQRSRIDAVAPVLDLVVLLENVVRESASGPKDVPRNRPNGPALTAAEVAGEDFRAELRLFLHNLGKTPAYIRFKDIPPVQISGGDTLFRLQPDAKPLELIGNVHWTGATEDVGPTRSRELEIGAQVWGPMTSKTADQVAWHGVITILKDFGKDRFQRPPEVLRTSAYIIERYYPGEDEPN